ncbi:D-alanyl-D-alanine carboxypeptidase family protein, partial [Oscillibacter sp. CAG:155]|uniref:D-alanyl-D-alanine carboxypeptidase family protein n=1 Tax=Oscillibacter sp. CAG:155 TaxID=1262910 RepID=UPI00263F80D1
SYTVELARLKNGLQVDKRIYDDLNAMLTDCRAAGLEPIVCSAYRTQATQTRLYNNKVSRLRAAGYSLEDAKVEAARWVAPPGTSEHQTGLALDLVSL